MKKLLILLLSISMVIGVAGCGRVATSAVIAHAEETDAALTAGTEEPTDAIADTAAPTEEVEEPTEEVIEEERIIVAKSYQQVYPELYTFYDSNPDRTYSKWIYTLDRTSGFIGTIFFSDGTNMVAAQVDKDTNVGYDRDDNTAGNTQTGNKPGDVEGGNSTGKIDGDPTVNPAGKEIDMVSTTGDYVVTVTTKTIPNAFVDEFNSTPYKTVFSIGTSKYQLKTNTVDGTMAAMLEEGLYKNLDGAIYVDQDNVIKTNRGTFTQYLYVPKTGDAQVYAVTYAPKYATNSVYMLYADDIANNTDILEMLQKMIVEGGE